MTADTQPADNTSRPPVGVLGAGRMGHGIAAIFALAGQNVTIYEPSEEARRSAPGRIRGICELLGLDAALAGGVRVTDSVADAVASATFVIEAAPEDLALKQGLVAQATVEMQPQAILATNTSSLQVDAIATSAIGPHRVVGAHFWNPPHLVPLVEVIQSSSTSVTTVDETMNRLREVGKSPVHVRRDIPGFIGNRLQHALKREAIALVSAGVCDVETVDRVVRDGFGSRLAVLGPLEQSDLVGLDLTLAIHRSLIPDLDVSDRPQPLLVSLVESGATGMKAGRGFRDWTVTEAADVQRRLDAALLAVARQRLETLG